ncbi:HAD-IIA family hydrolase [Allostreptomyces psammosilenae]|uniref:HAD superfamily hydrolase (TIGR01450 family) n=1 Tax=Allostreptomyces psammosilenae TaxID=1892865 RepID=A0A852ZPF3_9ACTN|nr:HAD-IIA family hydrolase [Allostreptomyces psammosilenae]NYI03357.1 HAD superfamily hydrolase (TIGR01450 family) [Allostreptomyces psammosilenae]
MTTSEPRPGAARVLPRTGTPGALHEEYDTALLDLDGVVYTGPVAVPHAVESLLAARDAGMRLAYVTNNAARPPSVVAAHISELGIPADASEVVTSAQAAARLVAERVPEGAAVLVVGGAGLEEALRERGLRPVRSAEDSPAAVVQGYAPDVDWRQLAEASYAVAAGLPYIASNTDLTIPTARGKAPGNGALVNVVRTATGVDPVVAGKPLLPMHRETIRRTGARRPLVVGDRLDTDIEGAVTGGVDSLLVLTGVTDAAQLLAAPAHQRPTWIAEDLRGLLVPHPAVTTADAAAEGPGGEPDGVGPVWRCGDWSARVAGGVLELSAGVAEADRIDGLRAACAAAWGHPGERPLDVRKALEALEG